MADPFVAEVRIFPFNFPPIGWAFCNGQLLPLSQNTALFSLLGTTYGGNGLSNFALPNLQGRAALQPGQGPGLSQRFLGEEGGTTSITLLESEIPAHNHTLRAAVDPGDSNLPTSNAISRSSNASVYAASGPNTFMSPATLTPAGGGLPHNNMPRYLALNFCIALQGIFPQHP